MLEQTYKIDEYEITNVEEIEKCMDVTFLSNVLKRFESMQVDFHETMKRNDVIF
ncbi:hypothetical protein L0657_21280 [Dyadobacter sp. CY345]|uniref:hypothetical protein n=1 Tax=Dyadobacter sp. CY345 TaxID=2909335 RepID=UPI001F260F8C|nr:hypothetical protein [Dyadobacter sp. CY345]MCF2446503.1 hypothetical protein [Dyadobacter sp. CY345]